MLQGRLNCIYFSITCRCIRWE